MRGIVPPDAQTSVSSECYAVVYAPRRKRHRFPASCVEVADNEEAALRAAAPKDQRYAARVVGPSKSSEGQYLYYVLDWLTQP